MGDERHSFGYHLVSPPFGDYSLAGAANKPVGAYACAIDISMSWSASRRWLRWLITEISEDHITGIAEVIGSYDGKFVRYWSDGSGWEDDGVAYQGEGHDTWTHVGIYRSTARDDHKILAGWTATGYTGDTMADDYGPYGKPAPVGDRTVPVMIADLWNQERAGISPYDGKSQTARTAQLARIEAYAKAAAEKGTVDAVAVAKALEPLVAKAVADEIARRMEA